MEASANREERLLIDDEQLLVKRLKEGDTSALAALWEAYSGQLYSSVIFPKLLNRELSEEVLQNTFLKAYERIDRYQWQDHGILPWLKTIARNLSMDVHRSYRRIEKLSDGYGRYMEVIEPSNTATRRPDQVLAEHEKLHMIKSRVRSVLNSGKLNERYQKVIEMRLFQELEREECAEELGVKVGTFDVLFHRAIKRFEVLYRKTYEGQDG